MPSTGLMNIVKRALHKEGVFPPTNPLLARSPASVSMMSPVIGARGQAPQALKPSPSPKPHPMTQTTTKVTRFAPPQGIGPGQQTTQTSGQDATGQSYQEPMQQGSEMYQMASYLDPILELHALGFLPDQILEKTAELIELGLEFQRTLSKGASIRKTALFGFGQAPGLVGRIGQTVGGLGRAAGQFLHSPLGGHLAIGGALAAGGTIAGMMSRAMVNLQISKAKDQMLEMFPDLKRADPGQVNSIFDTVAQIAPHVATVPRLVGTTVEGVLHMPGGTIGPDLAQSLMRLEEQLQGQPGMAQAVGEGAGRAFGGSMIETALPSPQALLAQEQRRWKPGEMAGVGARGISDVMKGIGIGVNIWRGGRGGGP